LRRPAIAPPQAAISAVEGLKILAGLGRPGPNATLGAADFDDIRDLGAGRDPPVEPVAAQIGEAPPHDFLQLTRGPRDRDRRVRWIL
jgi:hypothetical protein